MPKKIIYILLAVALICLNCMISCTGPNSEAIRRIKHQSPSKKEQPHHPIKIYREYLDSHSATI